MTAPAPKLKLPKGVKVTAFDPKRMRKTRIRGREAARAATTQSEKDELQRKFSLTGGRRGVIKFDFSTASNNFLRYDRRQKNSRPSLAKMT